MNVLNLILGLLPIGEEIASIFVHNPNSQHKFTAIVGTVNELTPVLTQLGQTAAAASTDAAPATPAGFVPAGVPSAHTS